MGEKDFFTQELKVGRVEDHSWLFCQHLCEGRKVLHVGCTDYPIFNPEGNLHIEMGKYAKELHGVDPNGTEELSKRYNGKYFKRLHEADSYYDVILVPNVLEHVKDAGLFIQDLFEVKFRTLFVLVPDYSISKQATYDNGIFAERIHPDHYAWYSPYTLLNLFKSQIDRGHFTYELNFFDGGNMISILITNPHIK